MDKRNVAVARACVPGSAFVVLCLCVALGLTQTLDRWGLTVGTAFSSSLLELTGALLTLVGEASLTSLITLALTCYWWRRHEGYVFTPVLFFTGVGIEMVLKYSLPHPGPPDEFSRPLHLIPLSHLPSLLVVHFSPPYSFPSGHMLRTTFLVRVMSEQTPRWRSWGWVLVALMAVTRVSGNEHWMSDILGGVLLGWTLAVMAITQDRRTANEYGLNTAALRNTTFPQSWERQYPAIVPGNRVTVQQPGSGRRTPSQQEEINQV